MSSTLKPIRHGLLLLALALIVVAGFGQTGSEPACPAARPEPLLPHNPGRCTALDPIIRNPSDLPAAEYQNLLGEYLRDFCHRRDEAGWVRDKRVRDTGPFTAEFASGEWQGSYHGTHAPVVVWYSPEMIAWLEDNRAAGDDVNDAAPVPDGAVMIKEMYPHPAAACASADPLTLLPTSGAAVMVRDRDASHDGWFWGWFGWSGWDPDYPPGPQNRYPYQGFGQYCLNCHASAENNSTFADLQNINGHPGEPLVFLSQHFFDDEPEPDHHRTVALPHDDPDRLGTPHASYVPAVTSAFPATSLEKPTWESVAKMPSQTYDYTWVDAGGPTVADEFLTSSQCIGCHDAGSTGLQFDMTRPNPHTGTDNSLLNISPYATWRSSPMGLGGRDPVFFAQLASETETFHPRVSELVQNTCLGCHGVNGQRQHAIDSYAATGDCGSFSRQDVSAIPNPKLNSGMAKYGALARDGISCTACHRMLAGRGPEDPAMKRPENRCLDERHALLNPDNTGFAKTFTGSFLVGKPSEIKGPFEDPQTTPMSNALGIDPVHDSAIQSAETCGSCHTVHLPVIADGEIIDHTYEQTTYPEWAFSDYRTGTTPAGALPRGAGSKAQTCQDCHMKSTDAAGRPLRSKIASIQEYSNFPQAENVLSPAEIDLAVREGYSPHTLVGLNVFLIKMAQQFPDILGIRTQDPMMGDKGLEPLLLTEQEMLDQADETTASIEIESIEISGDELRVQVAVESEVGHKFPSGVGFRRAFLALEVTDQTGNILWASGRTDAAGRIVDQNGDPVDGEVWWNPDCSARLYPTELVYQPHYQTIREQKQVQIYQELVTAPAQGAASLCGPDQEPRPPFTTSFLSICGHVKDNRILPSGFLPLEDRIAISRSIGAGADLAIDTGPHAVGDDPDYRTGGGDRLVYEIDLKDLRGTPAAVSSTLYYQAIPPYYLEDRFCTSSSDDTQRLYFLTGHLNLDGTEAESWKLEVVSTGRVPVGSVQIARSRELK